MTDPTFIKIRLQRIRRDIMVEKRLRQQKKKRQEDITDVDNRIEELKNQARELQQQDQDQ